MKILTKSLIASLIATVSSYAFADSDDSNWALRIRAVRIEPENHSSSGTGALNSALLPENSIHVSAKTIPEIDITYFFTKNLATELVLTYPQKHSVTINSGPLSENIGSFKHLPPTLTMQYHFSPNGQFQPYVGAGINYTRMSSVKLHSTTAGVDLDLDRNSIGPALQVGMDIKLSNNTYINFDVKKVYIRSDVKLNGQKVSEVKVDPLLIGVGIGWRF